MRGYEVLRPEGTATCQMFCLKEKQLAWYKTARDKHRSLSPRSNNANDSENVLDNIEMCFLVRQK